MQPERLKASEKGFQQIHKALQEIKDIEDWAEDDEEWIECAAKRHDSSWKEGDEFPLGFSISTWKRFINGTKGKPVKINAKAFKAFCSVLELNWEDIIEKNEPKQENYQNKANILPNNNVNDHEYEILNIKPSVKFPCQNLPHCSYIDFFGRHRKLPLLKKQLALSNNISAINITGIGGVGKTSLILEAANYCLKISEEKSDKNYQYDALIFSTFKQEEITTEEIIRYSHKKRLSCQQILNDILITFGKKELLKLDFNNCMDATLELLTNNQTLLIIDNLETVEDIKDIIWFLYKLPKSVKVVVTSRKRTDFGIPIPIDALSSDSGLQLIRHRAKLQNCNLEDKQEETIYKITCGIPLAIVLIIGQIAYHHSPQYVLENFSAGNNHIVDYCFQDSIKPLKGKCSYKLLTALALLPKINHDQAIISIANIKNKEEIEKGFTKLKKLNLIQRMENKYQILPIIRSYVLSELKKDIDWEQELRNSWTHWYQDFVQKYGGQDEKEWNNYQELEEEWENITDVIAWCIHENRYEDVKYFWQQIKSYSHVQGYQNDRLISWNNRLNWSDWLIENSKINEDYSTTMEVLFDRAWTLTLMGGTKNLNLAVKLFSEVWFSIKDHNKKDDNSIFQINLAIHIAYLRFCQNKITKAEQWLSYAKKLLEQEQLALDKISYQFMLWHYYQGRIEFHREDYLSAKQSFSAVLHLAIQRQHQRSISLAQRWLGNVAIEMNDCNHLEDIFITYLNLAQSNKDKVGAAFCEQSLAFLAKQRENMTDCKKWTEKAINSFEELGMMEEVETTKDRLNH